MFYHVASKVVGDKLGTGVKRDAVELDLGLAIVGSCWIYLLPVSVVPSSQTLDTGHIYCNYL